MHTHILGTGLTGLIGSALVQTFSPTVIFENIDLSTGVDITDADAVERFISDSSATALVHFAAFTDVTAAHKERGDTNGIVYRVNVGGAQNVARACAKAGKHLVHISTAYVFDGNKDGLYTEDNPVSPIEWYGETKARAEEEVLKSGCDATILRIDQPYRQDDFPKLDILHRIKKGLSDGTLPPMFTDHTFTATKIEEFVQMIMLVIDHKILGLYHATTDPVTTDYEFARMVKEQFDLPGEIRPGSLAEYLKATDRPYQKNTALDTSLLQHALRDIA